MTVSERVEKLTPLQRAVYGLKELRAKLDKIEYERTEPVAIIGMGCRFPGADNPDEYWQLLANGTDAIGEVPADRWDWREYYDEDIEKPGKMNTKYGGFLDRVDMFDPYFFRIIPVEAEKMDPQQRLLLEVAWEALENANLKPDRLAGTKTGVFVGITGYDYGNVTFGGAERVNAYTGTGATLGVAAGRLSYFLGLNGPSYTVDTACSSSLVAVHNACQSLRTKESNLCIAGGVSLILAPETTIAFSKLSLMAPDGRCKTFDAAADGYVRGEGCGVLILKRLSDALADNDRIFALVRGSALNQDGASGGLAVPSGRAQEKVIRDALSRTGLSPDDIDYIEAHGSGTSLGDPIEINAMAEVFGDRNGSPLLVGSVKTNFGHLDAAAGMAGIIKTALSLGNETIPRHLHFKNPNPHVSWDSIPIEVVAEETSWPKGGKPRIAGINGFGFSGTNAHVIIQEAENKESPGENPGCEEFPDLLVISAKDENALKELAARYERFLSQNPETDVRDLCHTAGTRRSHFNHRLSILAASPEKIRENLSVFAENGESEECEQGYSNAKPPIVFLFSGQGSQHAGMGQTLYKTNRVFREAIDLCGEILEQNFDISLLPLLYPEEESDALVSQSVHSQAALFSVEYALAEVWKSWGVRPDVVLGHSFGEFIAACVAGVFSLEDGLKLAVSRARLMEELDVKGAMITAFADEAAVSKIIEPFAKEVSVAAINNPDIILISGYAETVLRVDEALKKESVRTISVPIAHPFHSPVTERIMPEYEKIAQSVSYSSPAIRIVSNVTGDFIGDEAATADYWRRHMRSPVQFAKSMKMLHEKGYEIFIEIGPEPVLLGLDQCLPDGYGADLDTPVKWLPSLSPKNPDLEQLWHSLAVLYTCGADIDWDAFESERPGNLVSLPNYPFQRQRHWFDVEKKELAGEPKPVVEEKPARPESVSPGVSETTVSNPGDPLEQILSEQINVMSKLMARQLEVLEESER